METKLRIHSTSRGNAPLQERASRRLSPLEQNVQRTRRTFLGCLDQLPYKLRSSTKRYISNRLGLAEHDPLPLIGEYTPWLVADVVGIKDRRAVEQVSVAWLHLYFFTLTLDDVIDRKVDTTAQTDYVTSCLLLQRGLQNLVALSKSKNLTSIVDSAFSQTAQAAVRELDSHRNRITRYTPQSVSLLGRKIGLLPICIAAVAELGIAERKKELQIQKAFESLATAIQLLDDLTDWEDDMACGNMTLPLTISVLRSPRKPRRLSRDSFRLPNSRNSDAMLLSMIQTRAIEETLTFACAALEKALAHMRAATKQHEDGRITKSYVEQLLAECHHANQIIRESRIEIGRLVPASGRFAENQIKEHLKRTRKALHVVAQKS